MTNEEVEQHYQNLVEQYGDKLPSPIHEPQQFAHVVKLYKYYTLQRRDNNIDSVE